MLWKKRPRDGYFWITFYVSSKQKTCEKWHCSFLEVIVLETPLVLLYLSYTGKEVFGYIQVDT